MTDKIISICKNGIRYDIPVKIEKGGVGSGQRGHTTPKDGGQQGWGGREEEIKAQKEHERKYDRLSAKEKYKLNWRGYRDAETGKKIRISEKEAQEGSKYYSKFIKQEPIADAEAVVSPGAIVSRLGHKGKVMSTEGDNATVSWEDASMSKVPINSLKFEGRVSK